MKKILSVFAVLSISLGAFAETLDTDTVLKDPETVLKEYKIEIRNVNGPEDVNVRVFSKTYLYPAETIKEAIKARLEKEGLYTKKKDNGFFACMGVKYNPLWHKMLDFYINVVGSKNAGTVNLLVSTGYDNYMDETNLTACLNAARWLSELEYDIKMYIFLNNLSAEDETLAGLQKDIEKLQKQKAKIEKKIETNAEKIKKFEAQRIKLTEDNVNNLDTKKLDREKEQDRKLQDEKNALNYDLNEVMLQIEVAEGKLAQQMEVIKKLKETEPKK